MNADRLLRVALGLADVGLKATLLMIGAALVVRLLRRQPAALRHLVWTAALLTSLALPAIEPFSANRAFVVLPAPGASSPATLPQPASTRLVPAPDLDAPVDLSVVPPPAPAPRPASDPIPLLLLLLWAAGASAIALHAAVSAFALRFLHGRRVEIPESAALAERIGLRRRFEIRAAGARGPVAMTWGVLRPVVLLSETALVWPWRRLEPVLLHELAHVRRADSLTQLLSRLACAFYWFNPFVWLGARALRAEAEASADDAVLRCGVPPSDYAEGLVSIAASLRRPAFASLGVPIMKQSKIEARVHAILDSRPRRGVTSLEALSVAGLAAALGLAGIAFRSATLAKPDLVALASAEPTIQSPMTPPPTPRPATKAQRAAFRADKEARRERDLARRQMELAKRQAELAVRAAKRQMKQAARQMAAQAASAAAEARAQIARAQARQALVRQADALRRQALSADQTAERIAAEVARTRAKYEAAVAKQRAYQTAHPTKGSWKIHEHDGNKPPRVGNGWRKLSHDDEIKTLTAQVLEQQAALDVAKSLFQRTQAQYRAGVVDATALDKAQLQLRTAEIRLQLATELLQSHRQQNQQP